MKTRLSVRAQDCTLGTVRMFKEELNAIRTAAKQANQSLSEYVRNKLLSDLQAILCDSPPSPAPILRSEQTFTHSHSNNDKNVARANQIDSAAARKFGHEVGCACIECSRYRRMFGKPSANVSPVFAEKKQRKKSEP